jgi:hypothetical protein
VRSPFLIEANAAISISNQTSGLHNIFPFPGSKGNATRKQASVQAVRCITRLSQRTKGRLTVPQLSPSGNLVASSRISARSLVRFRVVIYVALFHVVTEFLVLQATQAYGQIDMASCALPQAKSLHIRASLYDSANGPHSMTPDGKVVPVPN